MTVRSFFCLFLFTVAGLVAGCGGGGGSPSNTVNPTAATVVLKTVGSGTSLNGIHVKVNLPAGVTLKADASGNPDAGVVTLSGVVPTGAYFAARYVPPGSEPAQLILDVAYVPALDNPVQAFGAGEFATIKVDIAAGFTLSNASFSGSSFLEYKPVDGLGAPVLSSYPTVVAEVL